MRAERLQYKHGRLFDEPDWMHYSVLIFYVLIKCFNIKAYPRMQHNGNFIEN